MNTGTNSSLGELVWCPQWNFAGEGPYTIAAKMLNANNLTARYLRDAIRWKAGIGASLLNPQTNESESEPVATFGRILRQTSLATRIPHLYQVLADDRVLRYCTKCMRAGFQAAIAQIPGIDRCPIHGELHRNTCIQCGSKTPPYFLEDSSCRPGFSCRECGTPFGGDDLIDRRFDAWISPGDVDRLDPIHRWLKQMDDSKEIHCLNLSSWSLTSIFSEDADEQKLRAIFRVLSSQTTGDDVPESDLENKSNIFGPYQLNKNKTSQDYTKLKYARTLYKLIGLPETWKYRSHLITPSFGVEVPVRAIVPPELHAKLILAAQFKHVPYTCGKVKYMAYFFQDVIPGILNTERFKFELPLESTAIAEGVFNAIWFAALKIAKIWNQTLVGTQNDNSSQADINCLSTVDEWANRLGCWRRRSYFPIGVIKVQDPATEEYQLYFVVS